MEVFSPSGRLLAVVEDSERLAVFDADSGATLASVLTEKHHGPIVKSSSLFACLAFSPDETAILYAAEAKAPKHRGW